MLYQTKLDKAGLLRLPEEERRLFLALAHVANEIKGFQKLLLWSSDFQEEDETLVKGRIALSLQLLRVLAGKLNEGYDVVQKHFLSNRASSRYRKILTREGEVALNKLKRYFGKKSLVNRLRNSYAFHYPVLEIDDALEEIPDDLEFFIEDSGSANNLFYFAEVLAGHSMIREAVESEENEESAFRRLVQEVLEVARLVDQFTQAFMVAFIEFYRDDLFVEPASSVNLRKLPAFSAIRIDWFADTSSIKEDYAPYLQANGDERHEKS